MIYELFSVRKRNAAHTGQADVYQYSEAPNTLRVQIQQILVDAIGPEYQPSAYDFNEYKHNPEAWEFIHSTLCRELGVHRLSQNHDLDCDRVLAFLSTCDVDNFLDVVELCGRILDKVGRSYSSYDKSKRGIKQAADQALEEINHRFRQANFGFRLEGGEIIRVDSEYTHEEIVKPALNVLGGAGFEGAQAEFLAAHGHYRRGEYPQAITEAAKAFESTLKAACDIKNWKYEKGARATDLLKVVRANGLWPDYLDSSFDQLIATLSSGLPRVRNEEGAHGQGSKIRKTPSHIAAYALNLAATKIVLVHEATKAS